MCTVLLTHTQPGKLDEVAQQRQRGFSIFSFVYLLWKLETHSTTYLRGKKEDLSCWVRLKERLAKRPLAFNKYLHKKHKKERKYRQILLLTHFPDRINDPEQDQ